MKQLDIMMLAFRNVMRGRLKTWLCALAVGVGICSVCTISGFGLAAKDLIIGQIDQIGLGGIALFPKESGMVLKPEYAEELTRSMEQVQAATPLAIQLGYVALRGQAQTTAICGINDQVSQVFKITVLHGALPQSRDIKSGAMRAVIDEDLARKLYHRTNIVGKEIVVGFGDARATFTVSAVIQSQKEGLNSLLGGNLPDFVYIPYSTMNDLAGSNLVDKIAISCMAGTDEGQTAAKAARELSQMSDATIQFENIDGYVSGLKSITSTVSLLVTAVAGVAMVVGGIGVMNSMVSAVEKRTTEIGVYLALGAGRGDILSCFLYESILICLIGGAGGSLVSLSVFQLAKRWIGFSLASQGKVLGLGLCGAALCGVVFGLLPALQASRLNPIDAIRSE